MPPKRDPKRPRMMSLHDRMMERYGHITPPTLPIRVPMAAIPGSITPHDTNAAMTRPSAAEPIFPEPTLTEPVDADEQDCHSDTEEEDNPELEEFYLRRFPHGTISNVGTVFGEGVKVWKSQGSTMYTEVDEHTKRKTRQEELWGPKVGEKRKHGQITKKKVTVDFMAERKMTLKEEDVEMFSPVEQQGLQEISPHPPRIIRTPRMIGPRPNVLEFFPQTPPSLLLPMLPPAAPNTKAVLDLPTTAPRPANSKFMIPPYRTRSPSETQFHRSSAGIDPLGAHNRPMKITTPSVFASVKPQNVKSTRTGELSARPAPLTTTSVTNTIQANGAHRSRLSVAVRQPSRIVSGSFGSFEGGRVNRFDERNYRLLPIKEEDEGSVDIFMNRS